MIKRIREWLDRKREDKLLSWIASHDIRYEKYKYFYGDYAKEYLRLNIIDIDNRLESFIETKCVLIYAYDKNIYKKVKECEERNQKYLFVENKWETKLNNLIRANINYYETHCWLKSFNDKLFKEFIEQFINKGGKFLYCKDDDILKQI